MISFILQNGGNQVAIIDTICKSFYDSMNADFIKSGLQVGHILGGVCCVIAIYFRYYDFIWGVNGAKIDPNGWVKPMILVIFVGVYPKFFIGFENMFFAMDKATASLAVSIRDKVSVKIDEKDKLQDKKNDLELKADLGEGNVLTGSISYMSSYFVDALSNAVDNLLLLVSRIVFYGVYCLLKVTSLLYLLFIGMFGSIIIALSQTKWFEGGLPTWIARSVTTLMWMPVMNLVGFAVSTIQYQMIQKDIDAMNASTTNFTEDTFGMLFYFIGIGMYLQVPKIAGFIMESAGVGDGGVSQAARIAANAGASAAGSAGGAIAGAGKAGLGAAMNFIKSKFQPR